MIRRASVVAALLASLILPTAAALAQDYEELPPTLERSAYLQISGSATFETFNDALGKNSGGIGVRAGLRPSRWGSVEAQFEWVNGMNPNGNQSGDDWTTTFNARIYPVKIGEEARIQPYLLVGVGVTSYKLNRDGCIGNALNCPLTAREFGFASRWGGGVDFFITDKIAATADVSYVWATGTPVEDLNYVSLGFGVMYHFR